jgi:hypothetical protein
MRDDHYIEQRNSKDSKMTTITTRSKIAIRWTSDAKAFNTAWHKTTTPSKITSPAKVGDYLRELRRQMGGTYYAVHLSCNGREVSRDEISELLINA